MDEVGWCSQRHEGVVPEARGRDICVRCGGSAGLPGVGAAQGVPLHRTKAMLAG